MLYASFCLSLQDIRLETKKKNDKFDFQYYKFYSLEDGDYTSDNDDDNDDDVNNNTDSDMMKIRMMRIMIIIMILVVI